MGKPGLTADRSASGAMINKIIRRVPDYKNGSSTRSNLFKATKTNSDFLMVKRFNSAIKNDCKNPFTKKCVKAGKNSGCGC